MSNTIFKISNALDGCARRLTFASAPSWADLAGKLESIYSIPKEDVCISYTDVDGDVLVLSSDAELKEYYEVFALEQTDDSVRAIRFAVRSLSSIREAGGNTDPVSVGHEGVSAPSAANAIGVPVLSAASGASVDQASETSSSPDSDVEVIPRGESPPPNIEELFVLPSMHSRGHFGGGRGRCRFHGHHNPRDGLPLPPFPPFIATRGLPMPPPDAPAVPPPPPFAMFGRGRGGHHAHMHGHSGMRRHLYHPHSHPFHHSHHHDRPHHSAVGMSAHVPPFSPLFPPMRGEFVMM